MSSEQYFPTYKYKKKQRDILLSEFTEAQSLANSQTKTYGQLANIIIAIITILVPLMLNQDKTNNSINVIEKNGFLITFIIYIFGLIILRYFVDLQKQITINARKVVTLRTMLGLDYGNVQLTLPNWRVEGASNPFVIKYFNGWFNFTTVPFWLLSTGVSSLYYFSYIKSIDVILESNKTLLYIGIAYIFITYYFVFRRNLNDLHETTYLNIVKTLAAIFRFKLLDNFEYILYRVKLSVIETKRLKINTKKIADILIIIEDENYYNHKGINIKSLGRAFLSNIPYYSSKYLKSGGSTITMQLTRSLFIPQAQNKYLRKIYEILLSLWINGQFSKDEIIAFYLNSVRYESKIYGLSEAIKYFFDNHKSTIINNKKNRNDSHSLKDIILSSEEAFFLIERLSNITSTYSYNRIESLRKKVNLKFQINQIELYNLYQEIETRGLITKKE